MAAKAIPAQISRFALLKIEDDEDDDNEVNSGPNRKQDGKGTQQSGVASKKKKKKRKGDGNQSENAEVVKNEKYPNNQCMHEHAFHSCLYAHTRAEYRKCVGPMPYAMCII
jgi:hypothetical protein